VTKGGVYLIETAGGPSQIRSFDLAGTQRGTIGVPPVSSVADVTRSGNDDLLLRIESYTEPPAWHHYRGSDGTVKKTALARTSPVDFSDVEVVRETATSKDGTKVPLTILRKRGTKLDGTHPALLTGYGGFNISYSPRFTPRYHILVENGMAIAIGNLRGGSEFGATWHEGGFLTHKQNVFDDFLACAKRLVELGYTKADRLAIEGASNGGLLVGAALIQAPAQFRAVVAHVGIYDMLRNERTPNGTFNISEYGTVSDRNQFNALRAYSPYHHVTDGTTYPATLFLTGVNDARVDPMNSRKMVARLQAATKGGGPILLRTTDKAGHGHGTALSERIAETVDVYAFLFQQLGITAK
jgi:prolyl oligopeptidase